MYLGNVASAKASMEVQFEMAESFIELMCLGAKNCTTGDVKNCISLYVPCCNILLAILLAMLHQRTACWEKHFNYSINTFITSKKRVQNAQKYQQSDNRNYAKIHWL